MATIQELDSAARAKLTTPDGRRSAQGIFLMPTEVINAWYRTSDIPSAYRGKALRGESELNIIISDQEHYRHIELSLGIPRGKSELAHSLDFHNKPGRNDEPELTSIDKLYRFGLRHIDVKTPSADDIEAFIGFIESADDYNLLLPIELHPDFYHPDTDTSGIILPRYKRGLLTI